MKTSLVLLSLYSLLELGSAFVIPKKREEPSSSLLRATISNKHTSSFSKRDGNGIANLYSEYPQEYTITINVGTPPQPIRVTLDTGSSDLVIPTTVCPPDVCSESALFDTSKSSTFSNYSIPMNIAYGLGNAIGYVGSDDVIIGGISTQNQTIGFVTELLNQTDGTFGLGYPANAETNGTPFPIQIYKNGIVGGYFSIYFDKNATDPNNAGEIIFGGVDTTKFTGELVSTPNIPIVFDNGTSVYYSWDIVGQYMTVSDSNGLVSNASYPNSTGGIYLLIDTGSSYSSLPQQFIDNIVSLFNASDISYDNDSAMYTVPCDGSFYNDYTIDFGVGFIGSTIELGVPLGGIIVPTFDNAGNQICVIGASPTDNVFILGLSVISNFYMGFDFVNHTISFAPSYLSKATVSV